MRPPRMGLPFAVYVMSEQCVLHISSHKTWYLHLTGTTKTCLPTRIHLQVHEQIDDKKRIVPGLLASKSYSRKKIKSIFNDHVRERRVESSSASEIVKPRRTPLQSNTPPNSPSSTTSNGDVLVASTKATGPPAHISTQLQRSKEKQNAPAVSYLLNPGGSSGESPNRRRSFPQ